MMLKGKVAIVTGGSGAVGGAIVRVMAREGCRVAFTYKSAADRAGDLRKELVAAGAHVRCWPLDVLDGRAAADLTQTIEAEFGPVDILVNNAGFAQVLPFAMIEEQDWDQMMDVNVKGMYWVAGAEKPCVAWIFRPRRASGDASELPYRESPALEQWTAVLTGFVIKPLYMTLSVPLVVVLWRARSLELVALRWAMIWFFVGEAFCAGNYLIYRESSLLFEFLHSYGMVLSFGLTIFALLEGIDLRLVKHSDPKVRCAALSLCHRCIKHADVPCGLQRTFLLMIPAAMALCTMPFCARLLDVSYNTRIWGTFYNYSHPVVYQVFEIRYLPAAALLFLGVSWLVLMFKRGDAVWWSKVFFSAASGALGFAFFRLLLLHTYRDDLVWFAAWEELTELLFVVSAGLVLWFFRHGLFSRRADDRVTGGET